MAQVPAFRADLKMATATLEAVDKAILEGAEDGMRGHFGASLIGRSCDKALWYGFRWITPSNHSAQLLRIFARGHDEETRDHSLTKLLRNAGLQVMTVDPETGKQFAFKAGHFGGSMDGAALGVLEAPKTWHVVEYKTASAKMFNILAAKGVKEAKPEHFAQMQVYMLNMQLTRALYVAVCKDDDRLHMERIEFDEAFAQSLMDKAQRIIASETPPDGISTDATYFECKWCDHKDICHGVSAPQPTCRSCAHSTAVPDGRWTCAKHGHNDMPLASQKAGCAEHIIIPSLISRWAKTVDANQEQNWVRYEFVGSGGASFTNGNPDSFGEHISSKEIYSVKDKAALTDAKVVELRTQMVEQFHGTRIVA